MGEAVRRRLNRTVLLCGAVLLPLAFWPPFEDAFKLPQTFLLVMLAAGAAWAAFPAWAAALVPPPGWWCPSLGVLAAASCSWALHPADGQMVELLRSACFAFLALAAWMLLRGEARRTSWLPVAMALAGAASAAYSLVQFFGADLAGGIATRGLRPFSTMGNPDFLAAYLVAVFPFMVARVLGGGGVLWWAASAVTGFALLIAQSRGAWLGVAAAMVAAPVLWRAGGGRIALTRRLAVVGAAGGLAACGFLAVHHQGRARLAEAFSSGNFDAEGRFMMWRATMRMVRDHPLLGAGPGAYARIYPGYHARLLADDPSRPWFFSENAHNDTLQLGAETGLLGLGAVVWLLVVFWRLGWRAHGDGDPDALPVLLGLVALVVDAQFNFPWYLVPAQGWVWLILAWLASRRPAADPPVPEAPGWMRKVLLAAVVLCGVAGSRQLAADAWLKLSGDFAVSQDPGRWRQVIACAERSLGRWVTWEGRTRVAANAALAAYSAGDMPGAERWARLALADAPGLPAGWNQLGLALARQGRLEEGAAACREALRLNPHQAESWHTLGNIAFLRKDRAAAATCWRRALVEHPGLEGASRSLEGLAREQARGGKSGH